MPPSLISVSEVTDTVIGRPVGGAGTNRPLNDIYTGIAKVYAADDRPWVVGFSGGKDSTASLQLVWQALRSLPAERRTKPVYVIASDTQVETPVIVDRIDASLARINERAAVEGLPISAHKVQPTVRDSYWVNLIGKGYPAPSNNFRWCTERLKIKPANKFIIDRVAEHGEVVVVLGVRRSESATRAQVMSLHRRDGSVLARHSTLPNAFVYAPIEAWTTEDVWTFLLEVNSPWGDTNQDLVALYRSAQAGECPLVIDTTTPSCGNSRFGCWVCTVVERDKTMEALVDSGEEWLAPLLEFRDLLAETQEPDRKLEFREPRRRDGRVTVMANGKPMPGPYRLEFCRELVKRVLTIQHAIQATPGREDTELISAEELHAIRQLWLAERQDWGDSLPGIYRDVYDADLDWQRDDNAIFDAVDRAMLDGACVEADVRPGVVARLLDIERELDGMGRRAGLMGRIARVLSAEAMPLPDLADEPGAG